MSTYQVTAEHENGWWGLVVTDGLPDGQVVATQTKRLNDAAKEATAAIAFALEIEPADIEVIVTPIDPPEVAEARQRLDEAEQAYEAALTARADARAALAGCAADTGLTMRETGVLLNLSHQRVKQLLDTAPKSGVWKVSTAGRVVGRATSAAEAVIHTRDGKRRSTKTAK